MSEVSGDRGRARAPRRTKRAFRLALVTVLASFVILGGVAYWGVREVLSYPERRHPGTGREVTVEIARGMRFPEIARELERQGVIDHPSWFRLYAMHRGLANRVRAGKYVLRDDMTPREVLDTLIKGVEEVEVSVTIPEGSNMLEVFELLEKAEVARAEDLARIARDPEWLKEQGIGGPTAEGYLFPNTYRFRKPSDPRKVLETLVRQHRIVYDGLRRKHARSLGKLQKQLGWGDHEVVIMASIVEKEAVAPDERPTIASVFYNRLTFSSFKSRKLETDPTIRYGCTMDPSRSKPCRDWFDAGRPRLRRAQLDDALNPYNTYQHPNLPPGPIGNPGRASLEAAMAPADTEYLYFVARDERHHVFSKTYEEHARNVQKYQK